MPKDYGNLRTPAARHIALTIALVMGLSACGDAEWEKQGYESEEVFEQALAGGFQSRADFNAAQKYQVTTKSEWDALNQTVSDGGFASIDAMREAAELGYSSQAALDAALKQQAKEAGFASVAVMRKAQDLGYATQAEWDAALEQERVEGIVRDAADTFAPLIACRDMNMAVTGGDIGTIIRSVGQSGLNRINASYNVLRFEAYEVEKALNGLDEDAQEAFAELWQPEYQSQMQGFQGLDAAGKLATYENQCAVRVSMICARNNMRSPPNGTITSECRRGGIR